MRIVIDITDEQARVSAAAPVQGLHGDGAAELRFDSDAADAGAAAPLAEAAAPAAAATDSPDVLPKAAHDAAQRLRLRTGATDAGRAPVA